ncbi:MAG: hypothetical protein HY303_14565 [Candidatus Wallbacteria bacterium]|nr:hypothetical protein [Candidatus Wallbacteria bacterium]
MDFAKTLDVLEGFLEERKIRHALVGALALSCYGLQRATQDVDLLLEARGHEATIAFLESLGYETLHQSAGYSNHTSTWSF